MPRQEWVGIEPMGEVFLLTFLFIGLVRIADFHVSHLSSEGTGVPGTLGRACKSTVSGCSTRNSVPLGIGSCARQNQTSICSLGP